ncbi:DUF4019 domain-containing protein [Sphingomonas sp. 1P06PA]|uniref:helix-turn-helix domain-containing protein n=1 Tax=Sphingomonas sp. 1P06PA TaxID=554121 RepID=UPI0039A63FB1
MNMPIDHASWSLTEKEKETLRLMVRGHDAKSIARALDLSIHTINERLRDARRKMGVSSSREAARLLLDAEGNATAATAPESLGDTPFGDDADPARSDDEGAPSSGADRGPVSPLMIGVIAMTLALGVLALLFAAQPAATPPVEAGAAATPVSDATETARQFLTLVDQGRWDESYRQFGASFRKINSAKVWADTSEKVRVPLGAVASRTLLSQQNFPAPPDGYDVVKFRTSFANKPDAIETVTLAREDGGWRVFAIIIE